MSKGEGRSRKKCLAYVAAFVVFQTAIIAVLALTVMKIKSPKVRLIAMQAVERFTFSSNNTVISIKMKLLAQFTIKNTNFGHFKYDNSTLVILYNGVPLGEAVIPRGRTKARKTQRFDIEVDVSTDRLSDSNLRNEMNSGMLKLTSQTKLNGKVHLMKVIKKKKSGQVNCDWIVHLDNWEVDYLRCD